jgi:hypothetical protein
VVEVRLERSLGESLGRRLGGRGCSEGNNKEYSRCYQATARLTINDMQVLGKETHARRHFLPLVVSKLLNPALADAFFGALDKASNADQPSGL